MHEVVVFTKPHRHTIVKDHAVLVEHESVAALANLKLGPGVAVHPVQQDRCIRPLNIDFPQSGCVQRAHCIAHRQHFACDCGMQVLARPGVVPGALPLAHVLKLRALVHMPVVDCGSADRVEEFTELTARNQAKGYWCVVGPECGGAHLGNRAPENSRSNAHAVDVAGFALVRAKSQCGVALDVLNGLEALPHGQMDVTGSHVVLKVHKFFGCAAGSLGVRNFPQCAL